MSNLLSDIEKHDTNVFAFCELVGNVLENARKSVKKSVNISMVYTYFEIGKLIVENNEEKREQNTESIY